MSSTKKTIFKHDATSSFDHHILLEGDNKSIFCKAVAERISADSDYATGGVGRRVATHLSQMSDREFIRTIEDALRGVLKASETYRNFGRMSAIALNLHAPNALADFLATVNPTPEAPQKPTTSSTALRFDEALDCITSELGCTKGELLFAISSVREAKAATKAFVTKSSGFQ